MNTITLHVALPSQSSTDALHTATPTAQSRLMHIYRRQMDPPHMSTDALHMATPTARSQTIHIYRRKMDPPHLSIDALHTTTPTARSSLNSGFLLLLELQKSLLVSFQGCQSQW